MTPLERLHADIDARVAAIRFERTDWLCRQGCQGCCHRLADIPRLSLAEWRLLDEGLALLPSEILRAVAEDVAALAEQSVRPIVCPLLDRASGSCRVYPQRPIACRTYGFYLQRDKGLYCKDIEAQVDNGVLNDVVWGNHDAVDRRLQALGETRALTEWFGQRKALG
ncbi:YkgJ family cysteine cluster protein [Methylomonas koyamae]|uniref:YkgJ family cysteine cluster protein n=1 Tax=Methylomonas koyamae TaxID=702114 RepID=UPI0028733993|nr:YkgJ family cysteine cluster protein [Methylomonas koyamae]WNB76116.1 YkgJ family cysteine cluster protein [Methylomonas koyamae]